MSVKRLVLIVVCLGALGLAPAMAHGRSVVFVDGCGNVFHEPEEFALTCADGAVRFSTSSWEEWGSEEATTIGTLIYPKCPRVGIALCPQGHYEDEARLALRRPIY